MDSTNSQPMIKQSNILTSAAYNLSRNAKRIIYLALHNISENGSLPFDSDEGGYKFVLKHADFKKYFTSSSKKASRDIHQAARELTKKDIIFYQPDEDGEDGEKATKERNWAVGLDHYPKSSYTVIYFSKSIINTIPYKKGDPFTQYLLLNTKKLSNPYAMRLYESLCQWRNTRTSCKHSVEWMITRFGMPKSYTRMSDFRSKFLKVALQEINNNTDIFIEEVEEICEGNRKNRITHLNFKWRKKSAKQKIVSESAFTLEDAVKTYCEIDNKACLPTKSEIENLEKFMSELAIEGFDFSSEFIMKLKEAKRS
ncbi:RepB family plasmid replication initiator protein [uncultured Shewanella sp.]|uniref:RepB family plasmid replication initiator protein n=1 Tax=uncultured Shewanella sp. TaxID=173975 RepID=UPI00262E08D9|nr:RepB family plasmid replication initiator protein [uncultured Shewanella sp.]